MRTVEIEKKEGFYFVRFLRDGEVREVSRVVNPLELAVEDIKEYLE